jgi:hypothetical protein
LLTITAMAVFGLAVAVHTTWSQQPPRVTTEDRATTGSPGNVPRGPASADGRPIPVGIDPNTYRANPMQPYAMPPSPQRNAIAQLLRQLREVEDAAKRAEITKQLEAAIDKYFDEDLQARETELSKLEERVKKLHTQLQKRRSSKAEIIQLQLKVLTNEADGLGFQGGLFSDGYNPYSDYDAGRGYQYFRPTPAPQARPADAPDAPPRTAR